MTRRPSWWRAIRRVDAENPPGAALCRRARAAPYDVGGGRAGDGGLVDEREFALDAVLPRTRWRPGRLNEHQRVSPGSTLCGTFSWRRGECSLSGGRPWADRSKGDWARSPPFFGPAGRYLRSRCETTCVDGVENARTDDGAHVAYRILDQGAACDGPVDIVMVSGGLFPMEVYEDDPGFVRLLEGLCSVGRVVVFDRRGLGLSDPIVDWNRPVLDQWADDLSAVVASSGTTNPVVFAWDGKGVATRFAAAHRARLRQLVLYQPVTRPDDGWDEWVATQLGARRGNLNGSEVEA